MADDQGGGGFFARTGKDAINIGGHKVPIALIGGLAAVAGVVLLIRARSHGASVQAGQAPATGPATAADTGFGTSFAPDVSGALANISQQLTSLSGSINAPISTPPAAGSTPPAAGGGLTATLAKLGFPGFGQVPIFGTPGAYNQIAGWGDPGSTIQLTGVEMLGPASEAHPGSRVWWQTVTGGWVNADELTNVSGVGQGLPAGAQSPLLVSNPIQIRV